MSSWVHNRGSSSLDGVPATMYYFDQLESPAFEDTAEHDEVFSGDPGSVLTQEGIANDVSTFVNRSRRNVNCGVSDKVRVSVKCGRQAGWAIVFNLERLMKNTNVTHFDFNVDNDDVVWDEYQAGDKDTPFPVLVAVHVV